MASFFFGGEGNPFGGSITGDKLSDFLGRRQRAAAEGTAPLTGAIGVSQPSQGAIDVQKDLGSNLQELFKTFGDNQRQRINTDFGRAANNAIGSLQERGFGGSTGLLTDLTAVEEGRTQALSDVNQNVLQQQIGSQTGIANTISGLLDSSSQQGTNIISSLLGISTPTQGSVADGLLGGGGGGGGGGINRDPDDPFDDPFEPFPGLSQPGFAGGGGSGGGGSSGGGGGSPPLENPFMDGSGFGKGESPFTDDDPDDTLMYFTDSSGNTIPMTKADYEKQIWAVRSDLTPAKGQGQGAGAVGGGFGGIAGGGVPSGGGSAAGGAIGGGFGGI